MGDDFPFGLYQDSVSLLLYIEQETAPGSGTYQVVLQKRSLTDGSLTASATPTATNGRSEIGGERIFSEGTPMYFASTNGTLNPEWRLEQRQTSDLSPIMTFGTSGVVTSNPSGGVDDVHGLVMTGSVLYVVGSDSVPGNQQWRVEARWRR